MRIIVVGCGKIGTTIVSNLADEGNDVVAVDTQPQVIAEVTDLYDVMGLCGNGADSDILIEAGADKAELFVAVTDSDELNMLSCFLARGMGAKQTIARIRNPEYNDNSLIFLKQQLGLSSSVNPELITAREIYNIIRFPSAVNVETFTGRNIEMVELRLREESALNGVRLMDMRKLFDSKVLVCAVQRNEEIFIPDGTFELKSGDKIGVTAAPGELQKLMRNLGVLQKRAHSIMIIGASRISYYLAKMLLASGFEVKIIDHDREACTKFSDLLPGVVMICGDGTSQEVLLEEGINSTDAFVSLTGMDEENILISIFAASHDVAKVIAKVNRQELASMAEKLGLECVVSPQRFVADVLSRYARALKNSLGSNVETLYKIMDGKAEALEFKVQPEFEYANVPLKEMTFKRNILIAGITRGRKTIIPTGDDVIQAGDRVIVLAAGHMLNDLSDIVQ